MVRLAPAALWLVCLEIVSVCAVAVVDGSTASPDAAGDGKVVAVVNGEPVWAEDIERSLGSLHVLAAQSTSSEFDLDRLMFKVVNDVLIAQEARALGMHEEPAISEEVADYRNRLALDTLEEIEITRPSQPSSAEVEELYTTQYRRATFRIVTSYDREGAERLRQELDQGVDMAALARDRSVDPYRQRGGLVENVARIDVRDDIADVVFSAEPGALAGPLRTDLGWSVLRVDSFAPADPGDFARHREEIRAMAEQRRAANLRERLARRLSSAYSVEVNEEIASAIQPAPQLDGRLLPSDADSRAIVATVAEHQIITAQDYAHALRRRWKGIRNEESARAAARIVLNKLIEKKLLLAEALQRGYDELPAVERAVRAHENQLLIPRFLEEVVAAQIEVTEPEKRAYYDDHRQQFHRPPRVRLGQITVDSREQATEVARLLREGADLAWLAGLRSTDRLRDRGGDRGWYVPQPGLADFNQELLEAKIGDVLEPFGEHDTWVVLKVTDRREQGIYSYEEVSGNVGNRVFSAEFRQALDNFLTTLRSRSEIEIHEAVLANLQITGFQHERSHGMGHTNDAE